MGLLYTKMKIFHFKEKIESLSREVETILPPIHIRIKPTNICAHNCYYCAYRADSLQLGKDMVMRDYIPKEKIIEIVDDLEEMGVKAVTFSGGGDPFYYPYLLDTVKRLSETSVKFASLTNGAKLKEELAEVFAEHATWLRISIDGWDDQSYASYRGVREGEFTNILNNMTNFKKLNGKCYLGVCIIVDHKNSAHVQELIMRLKDVGVDSVKVSPCIISNDGEENNKYHRPIYDQVKEQVGKAINELTHDTFEIFDSYHLLEDKFEKDYTWCPYLQILPVIGADLNVYACHDKAYNLDCGKLGSIRNQRFKNFWVSSKDKYFQIDPSIDCNHHCTVNAINRMILDYTQVDLEHLDFA